LAKIRAWFPAQNGSILEQVPPCANAWAIGNKKRNKTVYKRLGVNILIIGLLLRGESKEIFTIYAIFRLLRSLF